MHESVLVYRRYLYLKWALLLVLAAVVAYLAHSPYGAPSGATWLGYVLGSIGAALIIWLMAFGLRKRIYGPGSNKLEDWLSGHVYLGLALVIVVTLHTGFQVGWNVHTLAYLLVCVVVVSGIFGVFAYVRYPRLMTENRRGLALSGMLTEIAEIDRECREASVGIHDEINAAVLHAGQQTRVGGGLWRQLSGTDPDCATTTAYHRVREIARGVPPEQAEAARKLVSLLGKKRELVRRARRDVQYKALMDIWLYFHVPLSMALLAALIAHVLAVFIY